MKRSAGFIVAAALVGLSGAAEAETSVKVSEPVRYFGNMPVYTAIEQGLFKENGLNVEVVTMKGGPAAASALLTGDVEMLTGSIDQALKMRSIGKDVKVIASIQHKADMAILVPASSAAQTLTDLKGKTIGVTASGSASDVATRSWIVANKLDPNSDFQIVGLGANSTVMTAFERGQIQAAALASPFLNKVLLDKTGRLLADFRSEPYHTMSVVVRGEDVAAKAATMKQFVRALAAAQKLLNENETVAEQVARKYFADLNPGLMKEMLRAEIGEFQSFPEDARVSRAGFDNAVQSLLRIKAIDKPLRYEDVVVTTFWP
jgi:NitT/TauT family transport system substrate-binding protein